MGRRILRTITFTIIVGLVFIFLIPSVQALQTYTETFNDDSPPDKPTATFYTLTTTGTGTFATTPTGLNGNGYRQNDGGGTQENAEFDPTAAAGIDLCQGGRVTFAIKFASLPGVGVSLEIAINNGVTTAEEGAIIVASSGATTIQSTASGGSATSPGPTLTTGTWYNITMLYGTSGCTNGQFTAYFTESDTAVTVDAAGSVSNDIDAVIFRDSTPGEAGDFTIDNLAWVDVNNPPPGAIGASATAAFTNLVGFDVDPVGLTLVVRTDGGDFVRVRDGQSLTGGGNQDTNCVATDLVFASYVGDLIGFKHCDDEDLYIRTRSMNVPTADDFNGCGIDCPDQIDLTGFNYEANQGASQLAQIRAFPLNYSHSQRGQDFTVADLRVGWAFSGLTETTTIPRIGFALFTAHPVFADDWVTKSVQYPNSGLANDLCVGLDGSNYYIAAVDEADSTRSWPVVFTPSGQTDDGNADVSFGSPATYPGAYANAYGISCGGSNVAIHTATGAHVVDRASGATQLTVTTASTTDTRTIAISDEFTHPIYGGTVQFVAYKDGSTVYVSYVGNGTTVASISVPTGTWRGIRMDRTAQNVWIATSTQVVRYDIQEQTTIVPVGAQGGSDPIDTTGPGLIGDVNTQLQEGLGITGFGASLFAGAFMIMAGAIGGVSLLTDEQKKPSAVLVKGGMLVGGIGFFLIAWALDFLNDKAVFTLIAVAIVGIVGFMVFRR